MKKIYSLLATMFIAATAFAQGSESLTNLSAPTGSYASGSYSGDNGVTWNFTEARKVTATDNITGTSIGFKDSGTRVLSANSGANGVGSVTYSVRSYFTGGTAANRSIEVYVNGVQVDTFTLAAMSTVYTRTANANVSGDVLIEFRSVGTRQIALDDISWTQAGVLSASEVSNLKTSLVKNTMVNDEIKFGSKADVKVYNMNGQVVKTASVSENKNLDATDLEPGMYIVTGTVNGEAVSQKILKK